MRSSLKRWSLEAENRGFDPHAPTSPALSRWVAGHDVSAALAEAANGG